ncbi:glutamyl-tRNA reductase [Jatrophihabitans telluris]|uniref:Glutamyl-tRNA reductase n=1 Tax=Jatrophihabitans telluris TaxID=2038343 RepID=A0ABY4R0K8_9ACTN|nr:glutamyl-tRNA reductase [Jatrophihabitans telluris]UQX88872.1 glutamyl-tRNA reductase [Jatrophihabitans telluris]
MSLLVVGLSHHSAPVPVLERASISAESMSKVLDELHRSESVSEVMALSTCNRIEVYADVARFHPAVVDISTVLARLAGMGVNDLGEHLYVHFAEAAVDHLLQVASGLDSMVVGESQILGQLRSAYAVGTEAHTVGRVLHEASQTALRVGKRVHSETGIDRAGASVVSVALEHAVSLLSGTATSTGAAASGVGHAPDSADAATVLAGKRIVIFGAGSMGALTGATLQRLVGGQPLDVVVINRSAERGERLAGILGGRAVGIDRLAEEIAQADLLISSTGATGLVVETSDVGPRHGRQLVVLDLALPRDVDPSTSLMPDVQYIDLEVLRSSGAMVSDAEIAAATDIVAAELRSYLENQQALAVAPTVTALRSRAAQVVDAELLRLDNRLPGLDADIRDEVASAVRRAVDKVLHAPTVRVKELAATPEGNAYAAALRELFDLDPAGPGAVTAVRKSPSGGDPHDGN